MPHTDLIAQLQDLRHLDWTEHHGSSGTGGMLLKARESQGEHAIYYKLSSYDDYRGIYGHECVNELVASRLMDVLQVPHLRYRLVHALVSIRGTEHRTWLCSSASFRRRGERKQALDTYYSLNAAPGQSPYDFCVEQGWREQVHQMMLVDFLIANRDRHGANVELIVDRAGHVRMAPIFDCGLSFVFSCFDDEERVRAFDPMTDVAANNFLGSRSLAYNLEHFDVQPCVHPLAEADRARIMGGLEPALPHTHLEAIWNILWQRWCWYEGLCSR